MPAFEAGRSLKLGEHVMLGGSPAAHHIVDVLRARHGERIVLFHAGQLYDAVVEDSSRSGLSVSVEGVRQSPFLGHSAVLLQAAIRPTLLDDVVHVCAPLGVSRFVLYAAEYSQPWNVAGRLERLNQVAMSSAEQAETGNVPAVELETALQGALASLEPGGTLIMMSPRATSTMTQCARDGSLALDGPVVVAVGPEGGFSGSEEALLADRGALSVRLNSGILRSELAGFAAMLVLRELQATR
ncbi:MAG TPA: RsmE family RNA methyltransferase [Clostridia bacterium]|nr:RsmE family RNA methyltransferase [Clostridia bacterium]